MVNNGYHQYQRANVTSASPEMLIILLYTELLRSLNAAREAQLTKDSTAKFKHTSKAITILAELMISIDMEKGEQIALNLVMLYEYVAKKLLQAGRSATTEPFDEAIRLLAPLKEAWEAIAAAPSPDPDLVPDPPLARLEPIKV